MTSPTPGDPVHLIHLSPSPSPDTLRYQAHPAAMPQIEAPPSPSSTDQSMLQYTAGGHVLGFRTDGVWIASNDHVLQLTFLGATPVEPTSVQSSPNEGHTRPLSQVTYDQLWQGISLVYSAEEAGLFKTNFLLQPGAQVNRIRLSSNVLDSDECVR